MTDGRERAIGGHNKPIAIRSLGCDAIGIAIHKFLATMVGNRESDFRGAQWIGRLLRLEGDALVGAHAFPVVDDRVSNMMSRNEGVWLSNGWVRALLWIFFPCFLYTVISIVYLVASYIDK